MKTLRPFPRSLQSTAFAASSLVLFSIVGGLVGCGDSTSKADADPQTVIARFSGAGGGEIRRGEIQAAIDSNLASKPQPVAPEVKAAIVRKIVERRVRTEMLFREAKAKGYEQRPEVQFRQVANEERILAEDLLDREVKAKAADAVVAAEVDRRLAAANSEEMRKFSHIYLRAPQSDAAARQGAQATMAKIQSELRAGKSFNDLAETYSTSVMARGGGRIEWTAKRPLNPAVGDAIFALEKEGDTSAVIATPDGLHLARLDGIRKAAAVDAAAVRRAVRQELDNEARNAAVRARRQQELDARGVELASASRLGSTSDGWVARWSGGEISGKELQAVSGKFLLVPTPIEAELRALVENRLLASVRRSQGLTPDLEARVAEARRLAVINSYRGDLIAQFDTAPTEEEIVRFHRENAESSIAFRDFVVDVLYFPQGGEDVAPVYAAGETVGALLRQGKSFDEILDHPVRPDAQICREQHGTDLEAIGQTSLRLRKAIVNLEVGDVSPAIYLDRAVAIAPPDCSLPGRGVAFVRLRESGLLSLDFARARIVRALSQQKVDAGVNAVQQRLIAESKLEILVPEG